MPMPKKVLIALPPAMLDLVDHVAACEHRTRSDLIREALRRYLDNFKRANAHPARQLADVLDQALPVVPAPPPPQSPTLLEIIENNLAVPKSPNKSEARKVDNYGWRDRPLG